MYTGKLIEELMATVERAEQGAMRKRRLEEMELQRMYDLQVFEMQHDLILAGAA